MMIVSALLTAALLDTASAADVRRLRDLEPRHAAGERSAALRASLMTSYPAGTPVAEAEHGLTAGGGQCAPGRGTGRSCALMHRELHRGVHREVIWTVRLQGDGAGALQGLTVARHTWEPPPAH